MPSKKHAILPAIILIAVVGGGVFGYYKMRASAPPLPTFKVAKGDLDLTVKARGEIRAQRSVTLSAPPRIGDVSIVQMIPSGTVVSAGQDCIEIDATSERDRLTQMESSIRQLDARLESQRAQFRSGDEEDQVRLQDLTFSVRGAELDVKKAEVQSVIDGEKAKIALLEAQRRLADYKVQMAVHQRQHNFSLEQAAARRKSAERDYNLAADNIQHTLLKAPISGIFQALSNRRQGMMRMGGGGQPAPEYKQGDRAFPGASIGEIPDLTTLAVELAIDETDRGKIAVGQMVRMKVDAFSDSNVVGKIESISALSQIDRTVVPPARTFRTVVSIDLKTVKLGAKKAPQQVAQNQPQVGNGRAAPAGAGEAPGDIAQDPNAAGADASAGGGRRGGRGDSGGGQGADSQGRRQRGEGGQSGDRAQGGQSGGDRAQGGQTGGQGGQGGDRAQGGQTGGQGGQRGDRAQGGQRGGEGGQPGAGGLPGGNVDPAQAEQMRQRFQNMSAEERQAMMAQMRGGQGGPGGPGGRGGRGSGGLPAGLQRPTAVTEHLKFDETKAAAQTAVGDVGLRPGMSTTADIVINKLTSVVLVPARATFDKGGKVIAYVKKEARFEPRDIVLGYKTEGQVQVVSGLQPGEIIALEEPADARGGKQ